MSHGSAAGPISAGPAPASPASAGAAACATVRESALGRDGALGPAANPWVPRPAVIRAVRREIEGVDTYDLAFVDPADGENFQPRPGQFTMLYLPGVGEAALSLAGARRDDGSWTHTVRLAGNVTGAMRRLGEGGVIGVRGPFGAAWPLAECEGRDILLATGGMGLVPLRPVIHYLLAHRQRYGRILLTYGARSPAMMLYTREYDDWTSRGLVMRTTVDRADESWTGNVGVLPLLIDRLRPLAPEDTCMFSCGPEVMIEYSVKSALGRGIPPHQLWVSMERNMQCAAGLCGHCQLGPEFICKDGPVFRYDRIAPYMRVEAF